jgi:glycosyltransferase involved in cell wall biosynthesis
VVVPSGDEAALAEAIAALAADAGQRRAMGEAARRHVLARFSIERLVGEISELYDKLAVRSA